MRMFHPVRLLDHLDMGVRCPALLQLPNQYESTEVFHHCHEVVVARPKCTAEKVGLWPGIGRVEEWSGDGIQQTIEANQEGLRAISGIATFQMGTFGKFDACRLILAVPADRQVVSYLHLSGDFLRLAVPS